MASTYSSNLGIELIGTGDQSGTWGSTTNTNLGTLIEQAISGYVTQAVTTGMDTTITIPNGSSGVARNMYIELTGSGGASTNLIVPANKKLYFIFNNTSSGQVTVKVSGQTGISVPNGKKMILVSNGTDIVTAENYVASLSTDNLSLTGNLTLSGGTANGVLYLNGSKVATSGSALVFDGTNLGVGTASPAFKLDVLDGTANGNVGTPIARIVGANQAINGETGTLSLQSNSNMAADTGGSIILGGRGTTASTNSVSYGHIAGRKENGTSGNFAGYLQFGTSDSASDITEWMRITSAGLVGIGTASPNSILEASSTTPVITASQSSATVAADTLIGAFNAYSYDATVNSKGGVGGIRVYSEAAWNTGGTSSYLAFYTHGNSPNNNTLFGAVTERARIDSSGNLGIGTASPGYKLDVNNGGGSAAGLRVSGNDQANVRMRLENSGSGGRTWELVGGLPGANNANFSIRDVTGSTTPLTIDSSGNLCVGSTSPGNAGVINLSVGNPGTTAGGLQLWSTTSSTHYVQFGDSASGGDPYRGAVGYAHASDAMLFLTAGSERMRLDTSGNLSVGPAGVTGADGISVASGKNFSFGEGSGVSYANLFRQANSGATILANGYKYSSTANGFASSLSSSWAKAAIAVGYGSGDIRFYTDAATTVTNGADVTPTLRATLDNVGNFGLGINPSQWTTAGGAKSLEVSLAGLSYYGAGNTVSRVTHNAYFDGTDWRYVATSVGATRYDMTGANAGSTHQWFTSAGGTAGNAISFTQAMTLDASGNLLVGTTSVGGKLTVDSGSSGLYGYFNSTNANGGYFSFLSSGTVHGDIGTAAQVVSGGSTNFGINARGSRALLFGTNETERGRFTAGGYFKASNDGTYFGSTSSYHELRSTGAAGDWNTVVTTTTATGANAYGIRIAYTGSAPNGTGNAFLSCDDNASGGTTRATIRSNGGLANYQTNDVNLSDERVKTDIAPLGSMWAKIKALEIVTFKYKDQTHDDDNIGLIAQQVEAVAPEFVDVDGWGETPEDGVPLKSIYTADMYHAAIKALQEAMARIEQLEADMAALKEAK